MSFRLKCNLLKISAGLRTGLGAKTHTAVQQTLNTEQIRTFKIGQECCTLDEPRDRI